MRKRILEGAALAATVALVAYLSLLLTRETGRIAALWPANALVLAVVLRARPTQRLDALVAGGFGCLAASLLSGDGAAFGLGVSLVNQIEVALAAAISLAVARARRLSLHRPRHLLALGLAALIAPLASGLLAVGIFQPSDWPARLMLLQRWWSADALGFVVVTPLLLSLSRRGLAEMRRELSAGRGLDALALLAAALAVTFGQSHRPLPFMIFPALVYCAFRLPMAAVGLALMATTLVTIWATLAGVGAAAVFHGDPAHKLIVAQMFLATVALVTLSLAVLVADRRRTLRRLAEREVHYREIADQVSDLIVRMRGDRIVYISPAVRRYGYEPVDIIGRALSDFVHPDDVAAALERAHAQARGELDDNLARIQRVRTATGEWVWLEGNPHPVFGSDGQVREVINVFRDVTQRRLLEQELTRARDAAEAAARVKSDFLANMSHEIRTPLTAILGFTSRLDQRTDLDTAARTSVERIAGAGRALLTIVNDVLDFSKLEAGLVAIRPQTIDPAASLAETLALLEGQADAKGLDLRLDLAPMPAAVSLDPDRLRQILLNLVGNAIKFTSEGGVVVSAAYDDGAERFRVEVRDSGPGLSAEQAARLFVRFSQVDGGSTRQHGGTGLGLAICRGLVEAMGGEIGVTSTPGAGATFWFEVQAPPCAAAAPAPTIGLDGVRLLLADDHPVNRELVRAIVEPLGVQLTEAADGEEAVQVAMRTPVDVILMDLRMPGCDGVEAAQRIRRSAGPNSLVPILGFSADADLDRLRGGERAFDGLVGKPIDQVQLLQQLGAAVAKTAAALSSPNAA